MCENSGFTFSHSLTYNWRIYGVPRIYNIYIYTHGDSPREIVNFKTFSVDAAGHPIPGGESSGPIHQLWKNLFQGDTVQQTLKQEPHRQGPPTSAPATSPRPQEQKLVHACFLRAMSGLPRKRLTCRALSVFLNFFNNKK